VWSEQLPIAGAITHCWQLANYGRELLSVDMQTGSETCRIQQLAFMDGTIQGQQGFAYGAMSDAAATASGFKAWCTPEAREDQPRFFVPRNFVNIPGSPTPRMLCTTWDDLACR
jgi:hypothetical protein